MIILNKKSIFSIINQRRVMGFILITIQFIFICFFGGIFLGARIQGIKLVSSRFFFGISNLLLLLLFFILLNLWIILTKNNIIIFLIIFSNIVIVLKKCWRSLIFFAGVGGLFLDSVELLLFLRLNSVLNINILIYFFLD